MSDAAMKILKERYFLKNDKGEIVEDWEGLCKRVSRYIASVEEDDKLWENEFYSALYNRLFLPNTPTLMNAGKENMGSLHACFVYPIEDSMGSSDSIDGITDSWKAAALIGKEGGGIGYSFSNLRPKGDFISTSKGTSSGPISFMKVNDAVAEAVKQGGTRRIAQMGILNVHHPDILEFIKCKNEEGQIKNFNISVAITDKFMEAVRKGKDYELINPSTKKVVAKIPAKDIWDEIVSGAWLNGEPGVVFIDTINEHHNLKKVGEIQSTNPCCVTSDTLVLTSNGYKKIIDIINVETKIWNGFEWSNVVPSKTAEDQEIYDIEFSNGSSLSCTPYHKFYLNNKKVVIAENLKENDKLIKWSFPIIDTGETIEEKEAYTYGFYCGDGSKEEKRDRCSIFLYGEKKKLLNKLDYRIYSECANDRFCLVLNNKYDKTFVPSIGWSIKSRLHWLAGIIDSDGCKNSIEGSVSISSVNREFLHNIKLMINTLGADCILTSMNNGGQRLMPDGKGGKQKYLCQNTYRIIISANNVCKLKQLGLTTHRVILATSSLRNTSRFISVTKIVKRDKIEKNVYCFNEPLRHMGCFNGVVTGQSEQPLLPMEACVLGSIDVGKLIDSNKQFLWGELDHIVCVSTRFLDNTVTLSKAPIKEINETVSNNRKIGLGIMGFADCLIQLGITYGSKESFDFAEKLAKRIKEVAHETSVELGKQKGLPLNSKFYENTTPGTPDLKGTPRNACQISYAPTGTIASIADASFGIEPLYDVCFIKNILDGKRIFFVSDIVAEHLKELGYANAVKEIESGKTLEEIDIPVKIKKLFATTYTLTPEQHVRMQASFQKYCDSAISKTCNLPNGASKQDVADTYFMAYDMGCKGITVYRDGSRQMQVVETGKGKKESKVVKRPDVVQGLTYKIQTSFGKLYMTINRDGDTPIEVFFSMADISNDMSSLLSALGRTLSVALKHGTPLKDIIKTLRKIKVGTVVYYNGKMFKSVPQLIAGVLEEVFLGKESPAVLVSLCDKCGSQLIIQEGCEKCSNPECGYTKCG